MDGAQKVSFSEANLRSCSSSIIYICGMNKRGDSGVVPEQISIAIFYITYKLQNWK